MLPYWLAYVIYLFQKIRHNVSNIVLMIHFLILRLSCLTFSISEARCNAVLSCNKRDFQFLVLKRVKLI